MALGICLCEFVVAAQFLLFWNLYFMLKVLLIHIQLVHSYSACKSLKVNVFPRKFNFLPLISFTLKSLTMSSNALMEIVGFELCSEADSLLAGSFEKVWNILRAWGNGEGFCLKAWWKHSLEGFFWRNKHWFWGKVVIWSTITKLTFPRTVHLPAVINCKRFFLWIIIQKTFNNLLKWFNSVQERSNTLRKWKAEVKTLMKSNISWENKISLFKISKLSMTLKSELAESKAFVRMMIFFRTSRLTK